MLGSRLLHAIFRQQIARVSVVNNISTSVRCFSEKTTKIAEDVSKQNHNSLGNMSSKYQVFQDEDSEIILDVYEERLKYSNLLEEADEEDPFEGINLERGVSGVYEIEDLVDVLRRENAEDIFVAKVPKDIKYVDYLCIASGKSQRHMLAIAQFVRRVYKKKRQTGDVLPGIEGMKSKDWMAIDLGNIALHIFSRSARLEYDLDSLWAIGSEYDELYNKPEPISDILEKHTVYLSGIKPAS